MICMNSPNHYRHHSVSLLMAVSALILIILGHPVGALAQVKESTPSGTAAAGDGLWSLSSNGGDIYNTPSGTSYGNVGIGTPTPSFRLHIVGNNTSRGGFPLIKLQNTQSGGHSYWLYSGANNQAADFGIFNENTGFYGLYIKGQTGNVGIGNVSPNFKLDVQGGQINSAGGICIAGDCKTSWSQIITNQWATSGSSISYSAGNVGLGIANPASKLTVDGDLHLNGSRRIYFQEGATNPNYLVESFVVPGSAALRVKGYGGVRLSDSSGDVLYLRDGRIGVGADSPTSKLYVAGNIDASGDITANGTIAAKYQDVAEWVMARQALSAGTVVVLDPTQSNEVMASRQSYDTKVAGVISESPGLILGQGGEGKVKVATTGRVKVKVDARQGSILVGDLLVTSDVEGVAMKSEPINIGGRQMHMPGTLIGKALEPLEKGVGEILVLLSLQ